MCGWCRPARSLRSVDLAHEILNRVLRGCRSECRKTEDNEGRVVTMSVTSHATGESFCPSSHATSASTTPARRRRTPVAKGSAFTLLRAPATRITFNPHPVNGGTGRGGVWPNGSAQNSGMKRLPSSGLTTASRSPSNTSTDIAFPETGRTSCSISSSTGLPTSLAPISTSYGSAKLGKARSGWATAVGSA